VSIVPSVLVNQAWLQEDSRWIKMLREVGDKTMRNKCYYIIMRQVRATISTFRKFNTVQLWEIFILGSLHIKLY